MHIDFLLEDIESLFPASSKAWTADEFDKEARSLATSLMLDVVDPIHTTVRALLPFKEIQNSHLDVYWNALGADVARPHPHICTARVRPPDENFSNQNQLPNNAFHYGVSVQFSLYGPFPNNDELNRATFDVSFVVWGFEERKHFLRLFTEQHGLMREILSAVKPSFESSCYDPPRSMPAFGHLTEYYNEEDPENHFSLTRSFSSSVDMNCVVRSFSLFMTLFSGVQLYSGRPSVNVSRRFRKIACTLLDL